jgi:hypothetical protein
MIIFRSVSRMRDFHTENKVVSKFYDENSNKRNNGEFKTILKNIKIDIKLAKKKTPMHLKLYESTQQENKIEKIKLPGSHPSYHKKDDTEDLRLSQSSKKRVNFLKTSYNFLKNYY